MTLIEELKWRGFYGDTMGDFNELMKEGATFYIGTDPTSIKEENRNPIFQKLQVHYIVTFGSIYVC